jgi:hypothetical protein
MFEIFFSETGRLSLWFGSPIVTGAVFSCGVPWLYFLWCILDGRSWIIRTARAITFIVIIAMLTGLVLTQSRGPLLATMMVLGIGLVLPERFARRFYPRRWLHFVWCLTFLLVLTGLSGVRDRIEPRMVSSDLSIRNRLIVWSHVSPLWQANPIHGLGDGEAGYFYSQWLSPEKPVYLYRTVLNNFLEFGAEQGLLALFCFGTLTAVLIVQPFVSELDYRTRYIECAALSAYLSFLAYTFCGLSTSLLDWKVPLAIAGIDAVIMVFATGLVRWQRLPLLISTCAFAAAAAISFAYYYSPSGRALTAISGDGVVRISKTVKSTPDPRTALVLIDRAVLGSLYGKEIRRWLTESENFDVFCVPDPRKPIDPKICEQYETLILLGDTIELIAKINAETMTLIVVHPTVLRPKSLRARQVSVILPLMDKYDVAGSWQPAAATNLENVCLSEAFGPSLVGVPLARQLDRVVRNRQ